LLKLCAALQISDNDYADSEDGDNETSCPHTKVISLLKLEGMKVEEWQSVMKKPMSLEFGTLYFFMKKAHLDVLRFTCSINTS
jgi:hypothetical protein